MIKSSVHQLIANILKVQIMGDCIQTTVVVSEGMKKFRELKNPELNCLSVKWTHWWHQNRKELGQKEFEYLKIEQTSLWVFCNDGSHIIIKETADDLF